MCSTHVVFIFGCQPVSRVWCFLFFLINEAKKCIWKSLADVYPNSKNYWRHIWFIFDIYWYYSLFMNKSIFCFVFFSHKIRKKEEKSHKNTKTRKLSFWSLLILTSSSLVYSSSLSFLLLTGFKVEFRSRNISRDFPDDCSVSPFVDIHICPIAGCWCVFEAD